LSTTIQKEYPKLFQSTLDEPIPGCLTLDFVFWNILIDLLRDKESVHYAFYPIPIFTQIVALEVSGYIISNSSYGRNQTSPEEYIQTFCTVLQQSLTALRGGNDEWLLLHLSELEIQ